MIESVQVADNRTR